MWELLATLASAIGTGFLSAVFPAVNAEVATGVGAAVASVTLGVTWVTGIALGQTIGKIVVYESARAGKNVWARRRARKELAVLGEVGLGEVTLGSAEVTLGASGQDEVTLGGPADVTATADRADTAVADRPGSEVVAEEAGTDVVDGSVADQAVAGTAASSVTDSTSTSSVTDPTSTASSVTPTLWSRVRAWLARASRQLLRLMDGRWRGDAVLLLSASVGLPPLLATAALAGLLKLRRLDFVVCVLLGRLARFFAIAAPFLAWT